MPSACLFVVSTTVSILSFVCVDEVEQEFLGRETMSNSAGDAVDKRK